MEVGGRAESSGRILLVHGTLYFRPGAGAWIVDAVFGFPDLRYRWLNQASRGSTLPLSIYVAVQGPRG